MITSFAAGYSHHLRTTHVPPTYYPRTAHVPPTHRPRTTHVPPAQVSWLNALGIRGAHTKKFSRHLRVAHHGDTSTFELFTSERRSFLMKVLPQPSALPLPHCNML